MRLDLVSVREYGPVQVIPTDNNAKRIEEDTNKQALSLGQQKPPSVRKFED